MYTILRVQKTSFEQEDEWTQLAQEAGQKLIY